EGATIDVVATATAEDNTSSDSQTSSATGTVIDQAASVTTPLIDGTAQQGQTLSASASAGEADDASSYLWQKNGLNISGATGSTYVVQEGDEGATIDVVATATAEDNTSSDSQTSSATGTVIDQAASVTTPLIDGTAQQGQTLSASASAGEADDAVTYQWQKNGLNISGATGSTYVVQEGDEGATIDVVATATAEDNTSSDSQTSSATGTVIDQAASVTTPLIDGTAQQGQTLSASASAGEADDAVTYQWQKNGL